MSERARAQASVEILNTLMPLRIYVELKDTACAGLLRRVELRESGRSELVGFNFEFRLPNEELPRSFTTPCSVGKIMRATLWDTYPHLKRASVETLDAWKKVKVVVNGQFMQLQDLAPREVREGKKIASATPEPIHRHTKIENIVANAANGKVIDTVDDSVKQVQPPIATRTSSTVPRKQIASSKAGKQPKNKKTMTQLWRSDVMRRLHIARENIDAFLAAHPNVIDMNE